MGNTPSTPGARSSFRRQSVRSSQRGSVVRKNGSARYYAEATTNPKWSEEEEAGTFTTGVDTESTNAGTFNARFAHSGSVLFVEGDSDMGSYRDNACRDLLDGGWGLPSFEDSGGGDEQVSRVEASGSVVEDDAPETPVDPDQEPQWLSSIGAAAAEEDKCCEHDDCIYSPGHSPAAVAGRETSGSIVEFEVESNPEQTKKEEEWLQDVGTFDNGCCDDPNCNYGSPGGEGVGHNHGHNHADALEVSLPNARASRDYGSEAVFVFNPAFDFDFAASQEADDTDLVVEQLDLDSRRMSQDESVAAAYFGGQQATAVQAQLHIPAWVDNEE